MDENTQKTGFSIRKIVFATDFFESSRLALDYAVGFAHHYDANMVIMHAVELSQAAQEAEMLHRKPCLSRKAAQERLEAFASGVRRLGMEGGDWSVGASAPEGCFRTRP